MKVSWVTLRRLVLERDGFCCQYCGADLRGERAEVDHIIPRVLLGQDIAFNLVASCASCNRSYGQRRKPLETERRLLQVAAAPVPELGVSTVYSATRRARTIQVDDETWDLAADLAHKTGERGVSVSELLRNLIRAESDCRRRRQSVRDGGEQ